MINRNLQAPEIDARALGVDGHPCRRIRAVDESNAAPIHLDVDKIRALGAAAQNAGASHQHAERGREAVQDGGVHAEGIAVAHGAKAGRNSGGDAVAHSIRLAHGKQQRVGFLDRCGMAAEESAEVPLDRPRQRRVAGCTGEQRQRKVDELIFPAGCRS